MRNPLRRLSCLAVLALGVLLGCQGTSKKHPQPKTSGPDGDAVVSTTGPRPSTEDPLQVLKRFAPVLPVRVRAIGVFPSEFLRQAVQDVAAAVAYPLALEDPKGIAARIHALYGLDLSRPGPWCVFAWLDVDGPVLVCEGMGPKEVLERPPGAVGWNAWDFHGHRVASAGVIAATGGGILAIGNEPAVRRIAMVQAGAWPSLQPGMARVEADVRRAGLGGEDANLWFLDPRAAPWCLSGICESTAVFASRQGVRVAAEARPGMGLALKSTLEVRWQTDVARPFEARPLPDAVSKPADLLVRQVAFELRDPLVTLRAAPGDPVFLAAALYPDLVLRLLGPPK